MEKINNNGAVFLKKKEREVRMKEGN